MTEVRDIVSEWWLRQRIAWCDLVGKPHPDDPPFHSHRPWPWPDPRRKQNRLRPRWRR